MKRMINKWKTLIVDVSTNCHNWYSGSSYGISKIIFILIKSRLLARILKVGVQILCGPSAHIAWRGRRHAPRGVWGLAPPENFENLKPLRSDFCDSDSCWKAHAVALPLPYFHCHLHCHFHKWTPVKKNSRRDFLLISS